MKSILLGILLASLSIHPFSPVVFNCQTLANVEEVVANHGWEIVDRYKTVNIAGEEELVVIVDMKTTVFYRVVLHKMFVKDNERYCVRYEQTIPNEGQSKPEITGGSKIP